MAMGDMKPVENENGEIDFDPSKLNIDQDLFGAFEKVMKDKMDDPKFQEVMKQARQDALN